MSIEGQGHFFTIYIFSLPYIFQVLYVLCFTRPRYKMSVYRTIGPLVGFYHANFPLTIFAAVSALGAKSRSPEDQCFCDREGQLFIRTSQHTQL